MATLAVGVTVLWAGILKIHYITILNKQLSSPGYLKTGSKFHAFYKLEIVFDQPLKMWLSFCDLIIDQQKIGPKNCQNPGILTLLNL